jgi:hypothetical protein
MGTVVSVRAMPESTSAFWEILPRWHLQDLQNPTPLHGSSVGLRRNSECESRLGLAGSSWRRPARLLQFHPKGAPLCAGPQPGRTSRPAAPERNVGQVHARWRPFPVTPQAPVCRGGSWKGTKATTAAPGSPTLRPLRPPRPTWPPAPTGTPRNPTSPRQVRFARPLPICGNIVARALPCDTQHRRGTLPWASPFIDREFAVCLA